MINYRKYAQELVVLLDEDQTLWKLFWKANLELQGTPEFQKNFTTVRLKQKIHSNRMLEILDTIGEPTITNIGKEAAQAVSILALHDSLSVLRRVSGLFIKNFNEGKSNTYYQAIPSMVDRLKILERNPQVFGTQWEFDDNNYPFLPTVANIESVNERRQEFDIEPFRWPRSLAMNDSDQPWLKLPVSDAIMRDISDEEFAFKYQSYID